MELAEISRPGQIVSIGLETADGDSDAEGLSDHLAKEDLRTAIEHFGLHDEPLRALNYMDAVSIWASDGRLCSGTPM